MALENTMSGRLTRWITPEPDWNAVYAQELPRIYNYFRYRVGPGGDVEDLTSRTFEKAWRARHRYRRDVAAFNTWLLGIARNVATDYLRTRRWHVPLDEAAALPTETSTPEQLAVRGSDTERLAALMPTLDDRERELIALKFGAGLTNRDIARATGFSESNVGTIVHRAVETLRDRW